MKATRKPSTTRPRARRTPAKPAEPTAGRPAWLPPHIPDLAEMDAQVGAIQAAIAAGHPGAMTAAVAAATALEGAYSPCCAAYQTAHPAKGDGKPNPEDVCDYLLDGAGALRWPVAKSSRTDGEAVWAKAALAAEVMREKFGGLPDFADTLAGTLRAGLNVQAGCLMGYLGGHARSAASDGSDKACTADEARAELAHILLQTAPLAVAEGLVTAISELVEHLKQDEVYSALQLLTAVLGDRLVELKEMQDAADSAARKCGVLGLVEAAA